MAKEYCGFSHQYVMVKLPPLPDFDQSGWQHPFEILLHTGNRVWIHGSYAHARTAEITIVSDGSPDAFDRDGNCIFSVPADWCNYYTEEEAGQIMEAIDADERLLGYMQ
jgi:hypothetical protein